MLLQPLAFLLTALTGYFAHGQPHTLSQSVHDAAALARQLVIDAGIGTIMTVMDDSYHPGFGGHPFGIMEWYSGDYFSNGNLLFYMSNLQMSVKNIHRQPSRVSFAIRALKEYDNPKMGNGSSPIQLPRLSLLGEMVFVPHDKCHEALAAFCANHPEAKEWTGFHDFRLYELRVKSIYYVGGFGGINYIGWLPLELYQKQQGLESEERISSKGGFRIQER